MAIAEGIDRLMTATTLAPERVEHSWGGLRTFAPDGNPVVGYDPHTEGFFWLAGQGGYGIQTAPAMGALCAAWLCGEPVPASIAAAGVDRRDIDVTRLRRQSTP